MPHATQTLGTSTPFAKLVELGDTLIGAYAGSKVRQQTKFGSGELLFKDNKKPLQEEVLHLIAMPGTTAKTGTDEYVPVAAGDHVRYSISGYKWGQVIDGRKALPAAFGFGQGKTCSSDVYTFTMIGWSAATDNPTAATNAGFTVVDGRIVMRTDADHERWVINQLKKNANTNAGKDIEITVRRINETTEKAWMQAADELWLAKPWETATTSDEPPASAGYVSSGLADEEPPF